MSEQRIALIAPDGRHVWLGRYSTPTDDEYTAIHNTLVAQNMFADVFIVTGDYWDKDSELSFTRMRSLGITHTPVCTHKFMEKRNARLSSL